MPTDAERAAKEGYEAYFKGRSETANPYDPNDDCHLSWNDGYNRAVEEENSDDQT